MNSNYELCDTYPSILVIPTHIAEDDVRRVAVFRARHRIPVSPFVYSWHTFQRTKRINGYIINIEIGENKTIKSRKKITQYKNKIHKLVTIFETST